MEIARPIPSSHDLPRLDPPNVLWFFGAITAVVASIAILDKVPESSSDAWLLLASTAFLLAYALASALLYRRGLRIPAGLMAAVGAAMVPAAAGDLAGRLRARDLGRRSPAAGPARP
jgi:hypothetical protein